MDFQTIRSQLIFCCARPMTHRKITGEKSPPPLKLEAFIQSVTEAVALLGTFQKIRIGNLAIARTPICMHTANCGR